MRHLGVGDQQAIQRRARALLGVAADADDRRDAKRLDHPAQQPIARHVHGRHGLGRQLLRHGVAPKLRVLEEQQRAIIMHEVLGEETVRRPETLAEEPPEATPADFGAVAGETGHRLAGMLPFRPADGQVDAQPVPHRGDLAERHAGLGHAEGPGVHAEEEDLARAGGRVPAEVGLVRRPGVIQGPVDVIGGGRELQPGQGLP